MGSPQPLRKEKDVMCEENNLSVLKLFHFHDRIYPLFLVVSHSNTREFPGFLKPFPESNCTESQRGQRVAGEEKKSHVLPFQPIKLCRHGLDRIVGVEELSHL